MLTSVPLSNWSRRTTSALVSSSVNSSQRRTTQPFSSGLLAALLLSRCRPQRHSRIVLGFILSSCTRPKRAPIDSTQPTIVGPFLAFSVQTPSRSGFPYASNPLSSSSPVHEVNGPNVVASSVEYVV